ncbi:MAG: AbrB/MazE/SpoVT family DNA-binding domain-containing protein, partial [Acidimicrobiales bacterium]
ATLPIWYGGTMKTVTVSEAGRLTLPTEVRRALGLEGETEMEIELDSANDAVILRPAVVLRREDAWAYTPEHRELLARAHADSRAGRARQLSEDDLKELGA